MNSVPLKLDKYGISRDLYLELKYFCRQYRKKAEILRGLYDLKATQLTGMPHGSMSGDSVGDVVARGETLAADIRAIENAAQSADPDLYKYMLRHVTEGAGFNSLSCPCGVATFKRARRRFYWHLASNLNKI